LALKISLRKPLDIALKRDILITKVKVSQTYFRLDFASLAPQGSLGAFFSGMPRQPGLAAFPPEAILKPAQSRETEVSL